MTAWRITRAQHAPEPLSGEGAARVGNRWNSPGTRVAYTSTSRPLAVLEMLVHTSRETIPPDLRLIPLEISDDLISELVSPPANWNAYPHRAETRRVGDDWIAASSSPGLLVPSAVLRGERNLLINPLHPGIAEVRVHPAEADFLDRRLFK